MAGLYAATPAGLVHGEIPQRVICSGCGTILYEGFEILRPIDVMQRYNGLCPQCEKRLEFGLDKIRILPVEEKKPVEVVTETE